MVHRVKELVFVDESSDDEIYQAKEQHEPGARQNAVYNTNYEDKQGLRQVEAIAKDRRLDNFCVICNLDQQLLKSLFDAGRALTSRGLGTKQRDRIQCHTAKFEQS